MTEADRSFLAAMASFVAWVLGLVFVVGPGVRWLERRAARKQKS